MLVLHDARAPVCVCVFDILLAARTVTSEADERDQLRLFLAIATFECETVVILAAPYEALGDLRKSLHY